MAESNSIRSRWILKVPLGLLLASLLLFFACDVTGLSKTEKSSLPPSAFKPKPGHFVLMFSGNWSGSLGPCGCADKMLGGLDRRTQILNAIPDPSRLLLDTGGLIEKDGLQAQIKLETFLLGLKSLRYDAMGLSPQEVAMKENLGLSPKEHPPIIATGESFEKTLTLDGQQRRCLVLTLNGDDTEPIRQTLTSKEFDPSKPSEKCLVIVLMASDSEKQLKALRKIRAVDLVVMSGITDQPQLTRETQSHLTVVTTGHLGKYVATLQLPVDPKAHRDQTIFQAIPVEEHFTQDTQIIELIEAYLDQLRFEDLVGDETKLPRSPLEDDKFFVGSETCGKCHVIPYEIWQDSLHGHAMQTLIDLGREVDPECVRCHSVGMEFESGFRSMAKTPEMAGVGCEMCHGPGSGHIEGAELPYTQTFTACAQCHDPLNDPHFIEDHQAKFKKIKHWKSPPRPAWHQ